MIWLVLTSLFCLYFSYSITVLLRPVYCIDKIMIQLQFLVVNEFSIQDTSKFSVDLKVDA